MKLGLPAFLVAAFAVLVAVAPAPVFAQPKGEPAPAASAAAPGDAESAKKAEAKAHFDKGLALLGRTAWDAALVEFQASRRLFPTRAATKNAALCLRSLNRFDEALDMFETLLREFSDLPADERALVDKEIADLRSFVGTVEIRGGEAGATVAVDGRERGALPLAAPIRVSAGRHHVRVAKEGLLPFEAVVDVTGGQKIAVEAKLGALAQSGRLKVAESSGKVADVLVDNAFVGKTPWEGAVAPGDHTVVLRGEGKLGTQPAAVAVKLNQVTPLTLALEPLECAMRVEPAPVSATVALDGVSIGHGVWEGALRCGAHRVEAAQDGFLAASRQVALAAGARQVVALELQRDPDSPLWRAAGRPFAVGVRGGALLSPSLGGEIVEDCKGDCAKSTPFGWMAVASGAYQLPSGLGFGIDLGWGQIQQKVTGRAGTVDIVGGIKNTGKMDDTLTLRGFVAGAFASLAKGDPLVFEGRLGAGAWLGKIRDARTGEFFTRPDPGKDPIRYTNSFTQDADARYFYVAPGVRAGWRLGGRFTLSLGVDAMMLFALGDPPTWVRGTGFSTGVACTSPPSAPCGTNGLGTFPAQKIAGSSIILVSPGVGAKYEF